MVKQKKLSLESVEAHTCDLRPNMQISLNVKRDGIYSYRWSL